MRCAFSGTDSHNLIDRFGESWRVTSAFNDTRVRTNSHSYPKTWSDRAKSLTLPPWFGWEAGLFLLAPQTTEDVQHSGHERIWARVRPERYGFNRWNIGLERPEDHPPCRQFLR